MLNGLSPNHSRRHFLAILAGVLTEALAIPAQALTANDVRPIAGSTLDREQSRRFRAWFIRIISEQLKRGPNPRWTHRDCAGLVRFAAAESLSDHDDAWRRANGFIGISLPPPLELTPAQAALRNRWMTLEGEMSAFVTAAALIQRNSRYMTKDLTQAQPGDLLFFDQGDDQHLMVWMGGWIAYHTGTVTPTDNGLRAVSLDDLYKWKDTRWRPLDGNPNFAGVYRLSFLAA